MKRCEPPRIAQGPPQRYAKTAVGACIEQWMRECGKPDEKAALPRRAVQSPVPEPGDQREKDGKCDGMRRAAVAEVIGVRDVQLERNDVGVGQHRRDGAGGKQSLADDAATRGSAEHQWDNRVSEDGRQVRRSLRAGRQHACLEGRRHGGMGARLSRYCTLLHDLIC